MYRVVNKGETVVMKGQTLPAPRLSVLDDVGEVVTLTDASLTLYPPSGTPLTAKVGSATDDIWEFAWLAPDTEAEVTYRGVLTVTGPDPVEPLFAPTYYVYDPALLWANPADVIALTGGDHSQGEVVRAILAAQNVVGAWVSVPVQSPVPEPIRQATTFLAARALTTISTTTTSSDGRVISETVGDYTVRYADPLDDGGGFLPADIAALLAPYHSRVGMTKVGPASPRIPLPLVLDPGQLADGWWYEDVVIYDEEYE